MALIKCKECGADVSTSATACPKCGAPVPSAGKTAMSSIRFLWIAVRIAIALVVGWAVYQTASVMNSRTSAIAGATHIAECCAPGLPRS